VLDTFIVERLIQLNPALIQIFKACLFSNIEAVKTASLKHIEYIFDNIGCSIGNQQLISTIRTLIKTYPKANECNFIVKQPEYYQQVNEPNWLESYTK